MINGVVNRGMELRKAALKQKNEDFIKLNGEEAKKRLKSKY